MIASPCHIVPRSVRVIGKISYKPSELHPYNYLWFMIIYQIEPSLSAEEFIRVLERSTLAARRPVDDQARIEFMLRQADLIITARADQRLVGVARSISDFVYCTYLSDLAVDEDYQRQGIGKELIRQTKAQTPQAKLILLSAPAATDYYPRIGMHKHPYAYYIDDILEIN